MEKNINKEVSEMLKLNIIEPSESPFYSPVVIDPKKDSTNRFCVDYIQLYSQTIFDSEPIPDSDEMFSKLAGHKFFSKIDLSKGYLQVKLIESTKPKKQHLKRERDYFNSELCHLDSLQHPLHFHALCVGFFLNWITLIT